MLILLDLLEVAFDTIVYSLLFNTTSSSWLSGQHFCLGFLVPHYLSSIAGSSTSQCCKAPCHSLGPESGHSSPLLLLSLWSKPLSSLTAATPPLFLISPLTLLQSVFYMPVWAILSIPNSDIIIFLLKTFQWLPILFWVKAIFQTMAFRALWSACHRLSDLTYYFSHPCQIYYSLTAHG